MSTYRIYYRQDDPVFGGSLNEMDRFNRSELVEALRSFRFYAHDCKWRRVTWILKRGNKIIAKIKNP